MLTATEILIDSFPTGSTKSYNTSSILLGNLIRKYTDASGSNYFSPLEYNFIRPVVSTFPFDSVQSIGNINALKYNENVDYVFMIDRQFNSLQRKIAFAAFDKSKNEWTSQGVLHLSASFTQSFTGFGTSIAAHLYSYSSGSVEVNGVGVTGSSTNWATNRIFQGSRVTFGTTSSLNVTNWYEIEDIPTEANFKLTQPAPTYPPGTPYLIEELKIITPMGFNIGNFNGLMLINGVHAGAFAHSRPLLYQYSSSADDRKRGYLLLRDAVPSSSIYSGSLNAVAIEPFPVSPTEHYAYMSLGGSVASSFRYGYQKFNISRPVSSSFFVSGSISESFAYRTQEFLADAITGYNMQIAKTSHGPYSGSYCLYHNSSRSPFRVYGIPLTSIRSGSNYFINSTVFEVARGGGVTRTINNGLAFSAYIGGLDEFIATPTNANARLTLFKYNSGPAQNLRFGAQFAPVTNRPASWISETEMPKHFISLADTLMSVAATDDMAYFMNSPAVISSIDIGQVLFGVPMTCDWKAAPKTKQWVTFPPIETPNANYYNTIYTKSPKFIGGDVLGFSPEQLVVYYRTSGIEDDSGKWIRLPSSGDLKDVPVAEKIQFSIAFDILGFTGLYNRLYGLCLTYDKNAQDDHYQASLEESNISNNEIVWVQVKKWNSNIPNLKINIYNNLTNSVLINDTTAIQNQGTFEYSEDGGVTYQAWDNSKDAIGNRIKYTANSLPANTNIKIILNQS